MFYSKYVKHTHEHKTEKRMRRHYHLHVNTLERKHTGSKWVHPQNPKKAHVLESPATSDDEGVQGAEPRAVVENR